MTRPVPTKRPQPKVAQRHPLASNTTPVADPAITAREAMALLGVKKSAFYEWQQKGLTGFPPKRLIGRKAVRYLRSEVIAFRDQGLPQ